MANVEICLHNYDRKWRWKILDLIFEITRYENLYYFENDDIKDILYYELIRMMNEKQEIEEKERLTVNDVCGILLKDKKELLKRTCIELRYIPEAFKKDFCKNDIDQIESCILEDITDREETSALDNGVGYRMIRNIALESIERELASNEIRLKDAYRKGFYDVLKMDIHDNTEKNNILDRRYEAEVLDPNRYDEIIDEKYNPYMSDMCSYLKGVYDAEDMLKRITEYKINEETKKYSKRYNFDRL